MSWSTFLKAVGKSVGHAAIHPQRTVKGLANTAKTAAIGSGAAYIGWEKITSDKSVARIVGDAVVGESNIDAVTNKVDKAVEGVSNLKEKVGDTVESMNNALTDVNSKWSGMSNFLRGIFSGNGGDMIGNFFSNLGSGKVSGFSIAGLMVAALLAFGRFGWLGKIAGAVMAMMMIGNNANMSQVLGGNRETPQLAQSESQQTTGGMRR